MCPQKMMAEMIQVLLYQTAFESLAVTGGVFKVTSPTQQRLLNGEVTINSPKVFQVILIMLTLIHFSWTNKNIRY